jgi:hypothetical protein
MRGSTVRAAASTFRGHQIPMIFKKPYAILIALASVLQAADPPDTLTTANGEKLIGHLVRSKGGSVTFHSDTLGDVTIDWAKVKELSSSRKFAVIPKNVMLKYKAKDEDGIVHGTVSMADQKIEVTPAPGQPAKEIATKDTGNIIDQAAFEGALNRGGNFFKYWTGTITGGASLVEATQDSDTFTGTVHLIRTMPLEDWLNPSNRTSVNFSASYGKIDQPNTPTVKTEILHFDVERDEYFEARVYGFGVASFDHNFSQGLDLQQTYGGGIGWTAVKSANQTLDLKASANYQSQHFETAASNKNLIGSAGNRLQRRPHRNPRLEQHQRLFRLRNCRYHHARLQTPQPCDKHHGYLPERPAPHVQEKFIPIHHRRHLLTTLKSYSRSFTFINGQLAILNSGGDQACRKSGPRSPFYPSPALPKPK